MPKLRPLLFLAMTLWAAPASASPFCVQTQTLPPQCEYADAAQCRQRAAELNGFCIANPAELTLAPGSGKYCTVDSSRISNCIYSDRPSCEKEAVRANAVCIEIPPEGIKYDPYAFDPNRKY